MKSFARLALVAALATGVSGLAIIAPAAAKDKKEAPEQAGLKLSPDVLKAAQAVKPALLAKDVATAEPLVVAVETAAKTDSDKYIASAFRYEVEIQKLNAQQTANPNAPVNETSLAGPLDALIANPATPAADRGRYAYSRGSLAFNGKQYPQALQYYQQAKQFGFTDPNLQLQIVKSKMETGDVAGASTDLETAIAQQTAAGQKPSEDVYRYAIAQSNKRKNAAQTVAWSRRYVAAYPTPKNWRDVLFTYGMTQSSVAKLDDGQKVDVYRLLRSSHALADQYDYEDYAQKVFYMGLPSEAKAVLTEGRASGKVPASSQPATQLLAMANTSIKSEGSLTPLEAKAKAAANGKPAAQTGDAYLGAGTYDKAIEMYRLALTKGGVANDDVNTRLGIALAMSGDKAGAKQAFAAVQGAPRTDIASFWTTWIDQPSA